ncbi:ABC transporter permease subunit [Ramlibacter sp.]|uniref:ABC transporter permease n=1 Tax=Ramlibacter sp. TaxID=1917967 RepID=UPI0017AC06CC|nr:ABC transporter permease subunit [Ramlibacter sp.]MBA2675944.1 ABC transporter permease subunit [Ramlibacter sp.]
MAEALHALTASAGTATSGPSRLLQLAPVLTVAAFAAPIACGLIGTMMPAFGWLPAIGGDRWSLDPWRALFDAPGFATSLRLTLVVGWTSTLISVLLALAVAGFLHHRASAKRLGTILAPLLAMPHSALAIGFAFLILPSGWLVRWVSPGLTGWSIPPDVSTVGDASGWPLIAALVMKEAPFLLLMIFGALNQVRAPAQIAVARSMGYGPMLAWFKVVLPQVYPQIRLPIYAVLAFSLSVVDVAIVLGPGNPPTLAVQAVRWFADPNTARYFIAAAAATLLLGVVSASIGAWYVGERLALPLFRRWVERGARGGAAAIAAGVGTAAGGVLALLAVISMLGMLLWSVAVPWRFPQAFPPGLTLDTWVRQSGQLAGPAWTTLLVGVASTAVALVLTLACLENESRTGGSAGRQKRALSASVWLLYVPLLVPQIAFLFGLQVLLIRLGLDANHLAVISAHLVFVLPYLFLSLADPWRAFDTQYARAAASLGASPWRMFFRVKLPILLKPLLVACAVAFAVSAGQYLPTLFAGAGRVATLTTEAVTLSAGADRRVIGAWAALQALFPLVVYLLAAVVPRMLYTHRKGLA